MSREATALRAQAVPLTGGSHDYDAVSYGLDLYSLFSSIEAVLDFLDRADSEAPHRARRRYACFDHFGEDTQAYGYAAEFGLTPSCEAPETYPSGV